MSVAKIRAQLPRMRALAALEDARLHLHNAGVSGWCPAEHLDHMTKVTSSILKRIADPDAPPLARGISAAGRLILLFGWIPRGRGRAPEALRGEKVTREQLEGALGRMARRLDELDAMAATLPKTRIVPHPRFGGLTAAQALRFALIHNEHHLRIIRDVLA